MLLAVNECTSAQQVHPEPPKNPSSQPLHGRNRRDEPELTTPSTTTPAGKSSTEDEEKDDKNSSELNRDKREEDDDTPMHDGEELDEEGDKSDVGLESAAKNDTETTGEPSTDGGEGAEEQNQQQQQETVQENLEIARKKRDENQTENMDGGEQAEQTHVEELSGNQTAEDGLRSRNRRASATNNKAKMAVKSTKTAAAGGQRGPRGLETGPLE
ncbi:hypothetical protein niasHS_011362 [Heterodera schachtii]|uniref:Uncharacterized protein n=1 Tax=Heterodera schachtii TaxID=97005 RepID=A0ABD2IQU5_HETSC